LTFIFFSLPLTLQPSGSKGCSCQPSCTRWRRISSTSSMSHFCSSIHLRASLKQGNPLPLGAITKTFLPPSCLRVSLNFQPAGSRSKGFHSSPSPDFLLSSLTTPPSAYSFSSPTSISPSSSSMTRASSISSSGSKSPSKKWPSLLPRSPLLLPKSTSSELTSRSSTSGSK